MADESVDLFHVNTMSAMAKNEKIEVQGTEITILKSDANDYISLTDIARYKDESNMDTIIQN